MSTLKTTNIAHPSSASNNIVLDSSARVGIGTATPGSVLDVSATTVAGRTNVTFTNPASGNTANRMRLRIGPSAGFVGTDFYPYIEAYCENATSQVSGLAFGTFDSNGVTGERVRIDSSGRLLVGTSSSVSTEALLQVYRSSGRTISITQTDSLANGEACYVSAKGGARNSDIGVYKHNGIANPCSYVALQEEAGGYDYIWTDNAGVLRISTNSSNIGTTGGTVVGTQTSDERLKNVLGPVEHGLDTLKQIEPVRYSLKSQPDIEQLGFIAQQVQPLVPQSVFDTNEHIEGEPEDAPTKLGMEYVALIPVLVNAVKELSAEVDVLKAQLQGA
jgi:hypothetical protein